MQIFKGKIISCDKKDNIYKYLIEDQGKIEFTGNSLPGKYSSFPVFELKSRALLPSFIDTHLHFISTSIFNSRLDVRSARSFQQIGDMINNYVKQSNPKIVLGFALSPHVLQEKRLIERRDLDDLSPELPVMLIKYDGHTMVVNTDMMEILPAYIRKLSGFDFESGIIREQAFYSAIDFFSKKISLISLIKDMLSVVDKMAARGFGMAHAMEGTGFPFDLDVDLIRFLRRGLGNNFQFRLYFQTLKVKKALSRKLNCIGGCFDTALDGSFGSQDAALLEPYQHNPGSKGFLQYTQKQVNQFIKETNRAHLQAAVHAIGDAAIEQALNAFEQALKDYPRKDHRHTLIHAFLPTERQLDKIAKLKLNVTVQPAFLKYNLEPISYMQKLIGERVNRFMPLKSLIKRGIPISGGSDAPVSLPDAIGGIRNACNHFIEEESLSIKEALKLFTCQGAYQSFDEKERGSLEKGKIADMVILNQDPLLLKRSKLKSLQVEKLFLSGKEYQAGQGPGNLLFRSLFKKNY